MTITGPVPAGTATTFGVGVAGGGCVTVRAGVELVTVGRLDALTECEAEGVVRGALVVAVVVLVSTLTGALTGRA